MRTFRLVSVLLALGAASLPVPASAERGVILEAGGATVCDTSFATTCWHCYSPVITGGGWECFPGHFAFPAAGFGRHGKQEHLDGWIVEHNPNASNTDYRTAKAGANRSAPGSAAVVAVLQKLFPKEGSPARLPK